MVNDTAVELIQAAAPPPPPPPPPDDPSDPTPPGPPGTPAPPTACTVAIDQTQQSFDKSGGTGRVRVQAAAGCAWRAVSGTDWIVIVSAAQGTGNGEVEYRVEPNGGTQARAGAITIANRTHRIEQRGAAAAPPSCSYQLDPEERSFPHGGGTAAVRVQTTDGCERSASVSATWIVLVAGGAGTGAGEVQYRVEPNTSTQPRNGTITVANRTHRIQQSGAPAPAPTCSYELDSSERAFGPDGGSAAVRVQSAADCDWSASSSVSWIVLTSGGAARGNGEVQYRVERNTASEARSGTITIAGRTHRVQQGGVPPPPPPPTCSYDLDPQERSFAADGGTAGIRVRAGADCGWAASSNASWIVITSNTAGSGNGEVQYRVERNGSTQARSGSVTIAGRTHRIEQSGAPQPAPTCSYDVNPPERSFGPNGGTSEIRIRTDAGCRWSASANVSWIVITSARDGVGSGAIEYRVDPNTGSSPRSGSVSVAGHTVRLTQNAR